jgi:hypothetical protein
VNWNAQILPKKWQVFYISPAGDYAGSNAFPDNVPFYSWCLLSSVEVAPLWPTSAVVALGDSITDGVGSTPPLMTVGRICWLRACTIASISWRRRSFNQSIQPSSSF